MAAGSRHEEETKGDPVVLRDDAVLRRVRSHAEMPAAHSRTPVDVDIGAPFGVLLWGRSRPPGQAQSSGR